VANSLLDFVMALVRDPDAAAHYAADPAQAIADANLTDVTTADVNHLIPVVAESMSTIAPSGDFSGGVGAVADSAHNVWASGAATAAFDAFDDHLPIQGDDGVSAHVPTVNSDVYQPDESAPTIVDHGFDDSGVPSIAASSEPSPGLDVPAFEDVHGWDTPTVHDATDDVTDDVHHAISSAIEEHPQDPGFDIFT
jgi:hypothetical protein